jgi:tellurite resistance protein TehA-like permease
MVMATGIFSIASQLLGYGFIARTLLWLNIFFYTVLWALTIARLLFYPGRFFADLGDHIRGTGFFTLVAGTCVLGGQFVLVIQAYKVAMGLLVFGAALWILLTYAILTAFAIRVPKPTLGGGINGVWLVTIVATQSISVLCTLIAPYFMGQNDWILFLSFSIFLLGGMLYLMIIILIFYRFMFFPLVPKDLGPAYWINMGAAAISTLAGATLAMNSPESQLLSGLLPFTMGFTLFFWATATWWIPLLLVLSAWRYLVRRVKLSYEAQYWSMVFPLGMYATCTFQLAKATNLEYLFKVPPYFFFATLLAWSITFIGLIRSLVKSLFTTSSPVRG